MTAPGTSTVSWAFVALMLCVFAILAVRTWRDSFEGDELKQKRAVTFRPLRKAKPTPIERIVDTEDVAERMRSPRNGSFWKRLKSRLSRDSYLRLAQTSDADGQIIYLAQIGGRVLAHRDDEELAEDVITVTRDLQQDVDELTPTLSEYYARDITHGFVDVSETRRRARGDCATRIRENLMRNTKLDEDVDADELRDVLVFGWNHPFHRLKYGRPPRYPPGVYDEVWSEMLRSGFVRVDDDGVVEFVEYGF